MKTEAVAKALLCKNIVVKADSFNRFDSLYCRYKQENIYGLGNNKIEKCMECEAYERRG